ncbi:MAG: hypothetical protein APR54_00650 [Candidatus Cloacimonas sp. SDB]|nr:MAG: hypothetical protein APR54_00650 [Candidatus Cloacimonas sp. SDB]
MIEELIKAGKNNENIEDILSFIRGLEQVSKGGEVRGLSNKDLIDLEKEVCKLIVDKMDVKLPNHKTPYHKLVKWISSIDREIPIEIFTTNYDVLMEQALEDIEVPYFDGFVGTLKSFFDLRAIEDNLIPKHWTRLWKVHGSINWYQETRDDQTYVYRTNIDKNNDSHLIYPSHLKYDQSRKMPYLALIDQLSHFIKKKSSILIISGYSFNDDHLNNTIINSLKSNPTAMVLALMNGKHKFKNGDNNFIERYPKAYKHANKQHNLNIWSKDRAVIGTIEGKWEKGENVEESGLLTFIETKQNSAGAVPDQTLVKIEDFSLFTDFLVSLIGNENDE